MPARDGEDTKKQTRLRTSGPPPTHPKDREVNAEEHNERILQFIVEGILTEEEAHKLFIDPRQTESGSSNPKEDPSWHAVYPPLPVPSVHDFFTAAYLADQKKEQ